MVFSLTTTEETFSHKVDVEMETSTDLMPEETAEGSFVTFKESMDTDRSIAGIVKLSVTRSYLSTNNQKLGKPQLQRKVAHLNSVLPPYCTKLFYVPLSFQSFLVDSGVFLLLFLL